MDVGCVWIEMIVQIPYITSVIVLQSRNWGVLLHMCASGT